MIGADLVSSLGPPSPAWLALPLAAAWTLGLARWARSLGLLDRAQGALAARKLQHSPVPAVGGLALVLTLGILGLWPGWSPSWCLRLLGFELQVAHSVVLLSLALVLAVGLWDDLLPGGLGPLSKLSGQLLALMPLAAGTLGELQAGAGASADSLELLSLGAGLCLAGLVSMNVLNTFDNADGASAGVAILGFLPAALGLGVQEPSSGAQLACLATLGFSLFNLNARSTARGAEGSSVPSAYLGDSGAFVLALLVLFVPGAWCALWIPALDLARLSVLRLRLGGRPWIGDRRHLAHRLQRRGLGPRAVALVLLLLSLPACGGYALSTLSGGFQGILLAGGLLLGTFGFAGALRWTHNFRDPEAGKA